MPKEMELMT